MEAVPAIDRKIVSSGQFGAVSIGGNQYGASVAPQRGYLASVDP